MEKLMKNQFNIKRVAGISFYNKFQKLKFNFQKTL